MKSLESRFVFCFLFFKEVLAPSSDGLKVYHHGLDWSLWHIKVMVKKV